ncbi:MAG: terminase gpA endonuclease subunit [Planctomycetaceae bacterium]
MTTSTPLPDSIRERPQRIVDATVRGMELVRKEWSKFWKPIPVERPSKWIPDNIRLDASREATTTYDTKRRPWWTQILDLFADPEVRSISLAAATQIGKTTALAVSIIWTAENAPAPGMVVLPDRDSAIEFRDRLYGTAKETIDAGKCKRIRIPEEHRWNTRYIDLGSMRVYLAWSGARQKLRGRPCRYVWLSEVDVYKGNKKAGNPIAAAHQRTKAFFRGLWYHESSPTEFPSDICALEKSASTRLRWYCACPTCGHFQELRFFSKGKGKRASRGCIGGMRDKHGELLPAEKAREKAHYVCETGCIVTNGDKQKMLENGVWAPLGSKVTKTRKGLKIEAKALKSRREIGLHLWSIHSDAITFGDLAAEYIKAKEAGRLADFWGNWLGLEFRHNTKLPTWSALGKRLAGEHPRGTVPPEAYFITAGVDVQGENKGIRVVVRAWGPNQTSWLVDWFWLERDPGDEGDLVKSDMKKLEDAVLYKQWPIYGGGLSVYGRPTMGCKLLTIDSNWLPHKVHNWMRSLPEPWTRTEDGRVRAIRGDPKVNPETRWRLNVLDRNVRTNEEYEGGLAQWGVYVYQFYEELTEKLQSQTGKPGAWYVTSDALTQGKPYLEQVVNFGSKIVIDDSGKKKLTWGPISGRIPVDFWDCEIYAMLAGWMVVGDLGWDPAKWSQWIAAKEEREKPRPPRRIGGDDALSALDSD